MVYGAVVVGRPVGPGMIRPFTKLDFRDLVKKCGLLLPFQNPIEVAHPHSLSDPDAYEYQEGVLINVYGGERESVGEFSEYVGGRLIYAAQRAEELWAEYILRRRPRPWNSDLDHQKVCNVYMGKGEGEMVWEPCMKILEIYPDNGFREWYSRIASDFSSRTMEARIERYEAAQFRKYADDFQRLSNF